MHVFLSLISQNGYPSSRRSLVDDARFESAVVKQTKQAVLEEARNKSNGEFFNDKESLLCVLTSVSSCLWEIMLTEEIKLISLTLYSHDFNCPQGKRSSA